MWIWKFVIFHVDGKLSADTVKQTRQKYPLKGGILAPTILRKNWGNFESFRAEMTESAGSHF